MRNEFASAVQKLAAEDESIIFITGDLGYNALESLRDTMKQRFINAGVAEQNMVGVAAGLAHKGYKVFCYSIAPFVVYRCLEQFRNDVSFHNLPVFLVGNGGGYAYGIMGSSHHALEDLACLSGLQNVSSWVPGFADEVEPVVNQIVHESKPAYLRLGAGKKTPESAFQSGSFKILKQHPEAEVTVVALGPVVNNAITALENQGSQVNLLTALSFPLLLTEGVIELFRNAPNILVVEEHVSVGGLAQQLSVQLLEKGIGIRSFRSLKAEGYPGGLYGSQSYHQQISGLDASGISTEVAALLTKL